MKRAVVIVIDSLGCGALPDASSYDDLMECNTLANVAKYNKGLDLPNFGKMGLGNIIDIEGVSPVLTSTASYGKMMEVSKGKDTTTGHWELAGLVLEKPFRTYPEGFPKEIIDLFIEKTDCGNILGNYPASGTAIIDQLGKEHSETKYPIIYTSADSVFQIACNVDVIPLDTLYKWCEIARELLNGDYNVSRVIARPFECVNYEYKRISAARRDYSVSPPCPTILNNIVNDGGRVIGIGKIEDIFVKSGVTHSMHTGSNKEGLNLTLSALKNDLNLDEIKISGETSREYTDKELIFVNLVDTDMLFGHRNDAMGYGKALEEIDFYMPQIIKNIEGDDLLIITADHGCDPTMPGTDHTREHVPVLIYNPSLSGKNLGTRQTFSDVAATLSEWLEVSYSGIGKSLI